MKKVFKNGIICWLVSCVVAFVVISSRWPLTGDASLIRYVVFLMHHGMQPYRDVVEMNLPGSYLMERAAMATLGEDSTGARLYDLALLCFSSISFSVILKSRGCMSVVLTVALFVLIHGRDGPLMAGERDLAATALMLAAVAMLFVFYRGAGASRFKNALCLPLGTAVGLALTIKPTLLPLAIGLFLWITWVLPRKLPLPMRPFTLAAAGLALSFGSSLIFLIRHKALVAFWGEMHGLIPYHASLNNRAIGYLFSQSISPLLPMLLLWSVAAYLLPRQQIDLERVALLLCALGGLTSYLLQRKGFWYQRYPYQAFLLPLFMIDFTQLLRSRTWHRYVGMAGIATGVALTTACLIHLRRYDRTEPPRPLLKGLSVIGTPDELSGRVQCMDTIGGCIDALYHARIVQNTGFLYDCYMLDGSNPVALGLRGRFWQQVDRNPPTVFVLTDSNCYGSRHTFDKFGRWPEFQHYLDANYSLVQASGQLPPIRYWSHPIEAYQYRIYVRKR